MPVNLISVVFAWLSTHLVILSLLGFLLAGLFVFDLVDAAGPVAVQQEETSRVPALPSPDVFPSTSTGSGLPTVGVDRPVAVQTESVGSHPIHGQQGAPRSQPGALNGAIGNGFRPPTEGLATVAGDMTREDYVQQARRAFWNGDFEAAEAAYMALVSEYPADADAFGELGNLYQSMGNSQRAMDAYFEAAVRLKSAGENHKLKEVMELLEREGDPRVDQLRP